MAMPVVTVASGGLPVVDITALGNRYMGRAVTEALNGKGVAVTKVTTTAGEPVIYQVVKTDGTPYPK